MGLATPHIGACAPAGGAVRKRHMTVDATIPVWSAFAWQPGDLVRTPGGDLFLATAAHQPGDPIPTANPTGWAALTATTTTIPPWTAGTTYPTGSPVRLDAGNGLMRVFVVDNDLAASQNSPDTVAGIADGWHEVTVILPPQPQPPRNPIVTTRQLPTTVAGAVPQPNDPANPQDGDRFVNTLLGVEWVWADDPTAPTQKVWVRVNAITYVAQAAGTVPDPNVVPQRSGDIELTAAGNVRVI